MTSPLTDHILRRLTATGADNAAWSLLILAALDGDAALTAYLAGRSVVPIELFERRIECGLAPMWLLVRSRAVLEASVYHGAATLSP